MTRTFSQGLGSIVVILIGLSAADPALAEEPHRKLGDRAEISDPAVANLEVETEPSAAIPATSPEKTPADIFAYVADKWGKAIADLPSPVQLLPPRQLPIGTAEGKAPDQPVYGSTTKYPWLLVSHGDGVLSAVTTFLDDKSYDEVYRAILAKHGRGTLGRVVIGNKPATDHGLCMYWKDEAQAITMHFTRSVGTVLILTPSEVPHCKSGIIGTSLEQGV